MMYRLSENVIAHALAPHKQTLPGSLGGDVVTTYETSTSAVNVDIMDGGGNATYSDTLLNLNARGDAIVYQLLPGHFQIVLTPAFFTAMSATDGSFGLSLSKSGGSGWNTTGASFFRGGAYEALAVALADTGFLVEYRCVATNLALAVLGANFLDRMVPLFNFAAHC